MIRQIFREVVVRIILKTDGTDGRKMRNWYEKNYGVKIGRYTYGYWGNEISSGTCIGSFCSIATNVKIGLMNHPVKFVSSHPFLYYQSRGFIAENIDIEQKMPPVIEDDVWIGSNAVILPGVTVGRGAVVGAGSVVTKDVKPYSIVGGVPAKHIKFRFEENIRESLCLIDWPSWNEEKIRANIGTFYDVKKFISRFKEVEQ